MVLRNLWGWDVILGPMAFHCSWGLVSWHFERLLSRLSWYGRGLSFGQLRLWNGHGLVLNLPIDVDDILILVELLNAGILLLRSLHVLLLLVDSAVAARVAIIHSLGLTLSLLLVPLDPRTLIVLIVIHVRGRVHTTFLLPFESSIRQTHLVSLGSVVQDGVRHVLQQARPHKLGALLTRVGRLL
jgi:hypothetical protein